MTWVAELLTLLTQRKQHWTKPTLRFRILQTKLAIDQSRRTSSTNRESKHCFASPSIMICNHRSWIANWAAHKIALASATIGGQGWWVLDQALDTVPLSSLATTARAEEDSATAASTLSFIHLGGGGSHLNTAGAAREGFSDSSKVENSRNLKFICLMEFGMSTCPSWKETWFLRC